MSDFGSREEVKYGGVGLGDDASDMGPPNAAFAQSPDGATRAAGVPQALPPLVEAIVRGDPPSLSQCLSALSPEERTRELGRESGGGTSDLPPSRMTPVFHAACTGRVAMLTEIFRAMKANLKPDRVVELLLGRDSGGRSLLVAAIQSSAAKMVDALVELIDDQKLSIEQRVQMLSGVNAEHETVLMIAIKTGREKTVNAVAALIGETWLPADQEVHMVTASDYRGRTALTFAVASGQVALVDTIVALIERKLPADQVNPMIEDTLPTAISLVLGTTDDAERWEGEDGTADLDVLSCLLKHGAWPTPRHLSLVVDGTGFEPSRKCFLDAICFATNPLLVGMTLSLQLADAADLGNEGHRRVVSRLQKEIEDLVLEIFERLPQTVDGFEGGGLIREGMKACSAVFAPEKMMEGLNQRDNHFHEDGEGTRVKMGPLKIALQAREQLEMFCTQPLVLDFMSRKFTCGLPGLLNTEREMLDANEVQSYRRNQQHYTFGVQGQQPPSPCGDDLLAVLAGPHPTLGSVSLLPGTQFILAQLVARPNFCYSVPAIRMAMDLLVYLAMLVLFGSQVLLYDDAVGMGEIVFFAYVLGAILIEAQELWDGREEYMKDHWNVLDVTALAFCAAGFVARVSHPDSLWGRALYAAGAPLLLFRVLFFAQFLPAQGPMIEIIFSLAGELARFGTIMVIVMMGFAMSFFALFRESCTVGSFRTYTETSISLLRAMLGETKLFDDFTVAPACCDVDTGSLLAEELDCSEFPTECCDSVRGDHFDGVVGKALLVSYLVLMGIILLNLLIAVLSEAYVDVRENIEIESKVSRALVIQHYVQAVEEDMLPSPLNLVQCVVSLTAMVVGFCLNKPGYLRKAEFFAGSALFWLVSGLFAVAAGSVLWLLSWLKGITIFGRQQRPSNHLGAPVPIATQAAVLLCGVAMPLLLVYKWLWGSTLGALMKYCKGGAWAQQGSAGYREIRGRQYDDGIVGKALKLAPGGLSVQQLREYLANPMNDPDVQRDEESRETTVEHIKLLRDRLENTVRQRVSELESSTANRMVDFQARVETKVGDVVDARLGELSQKIAGLDDKLERILVALNTAAGGMAVGNDVGDPFATT